MDITRLARVSDADAIAHVQYNSWMERVPQALKNVTVSDSAAAWASAIVAGDGESGRVLVVERLGIVQGYCAVTFNASEKLCQLVALEVSPQNRRSTLGIRLTNAAADLAMGAGMTEMVTWLGLEETAAQRLLHSAGWTQTGAERTVATDPPSEERREIQYLVSFAGSWSNQI